MQQKFTNGAFILNRAILDEPVFSNPNLLKTWIYCIARANFKDNWISLKIGKGYTEVLIKRSQFLYGRNKVAKKLNFTPSQTDTLFKKLVKFKYISIESSNQYSIITLLNYNELQNFDNYKIATNSNQSATNHQPIAHITNEINVENDSKNKKGNKEDIIFSSDDISDIILSKEPELSPDLKQTYEILINMFNWKPQRYLSNKSKLLKFLENMIKEKFFTETDLLQQIKSFEIIYKNTEPKYRQSPLNFIDKEKTGLLKYDYIKKLKDIKKSNPAPNQIKRTKIVNNFPPRDSCVDPNSPEAQKFFNKNK